MQWLKAVIKLLALMCIDIVALMFIVGTIQCCSIKLGLDMHASADYLSATCVVCQANLLSLRPKPQNKPDYF